MTNIYEIQKEYLELMNQVIDNEGEFTPELLEKLQINEQELKQKAINYAYVIKKLEDDEESINNEIKRLGELKKANTKKIDKLKEIVTNSMIGFNLDKIESPTLKLSIRKSESVNIIDETKLSDNFFTTKITKTVSKTALKDALKTGEIAGAELVVNNNLQIK